jgi:hypothetical protein
MGELDNNDLDLLLDGPLPSMKTMSPPADDLGHFLQGGWPCRSVSSRLIVKQVPLLNSTYKIHQDNSHSNPAELFLSYPKAFGF